MRRVISLHGKITVSTCLPATAPYAAYAASAPSPSPAYDSFPSSLPSLLRPLLKILKLNPSQAVLFSLNIISLYFFSSCSYFIPSTYSPTAQLIQLTVCKYTYTCKHNTNGTFSAPPIVRALRDLRQRHLPVQPARAHHYSFVYLTFRICKGNLSTLKRETNDRRLTDPSANE